VARKVQQRRPNLASGYVFEGAVHLKSGATDEAVAAYRYGLDRSGDSSELAVALHKALVQSGRDADADKLAARWNKGYPDDVAFEYQLALTDIRRNSLAQAEDRLRRVLAQRPGHALAMNNLAWLLVARGKPGGLELARRAVDILPARPALMDTLAMALVSEKQVTQALEMQKKAVELAPSDKALRLNLAKIAHQAGDKALARQELSALQAAGSAPHIRDEIRDEVTKLLKAL
jgi:cellulose synthase operon protein C